MFFRKKAKRHVEVTKHDDGAESHMEMLGDKTDGVWRLTYPNGTLKWECNYRKDRKHGFCRYYNELGFMTEESHYYKGELDGWFKKFDGRGQIKQETLYCMGVGHLQRWYDPDGNLMSQKSSEDFFNYSKIKELSFVSDKYKIIRKYIKYDAEKERKRKSRSILNEFFAECYKVNLERSNDTIFQATSLLGDVCVGKVGEKWPSFNGVNLSPVMQLFIEDLKDVPDILKDLSYITVFVHPEGALFDEEGTLVVRSYKKDEMLVELSKPDKVIYSRQNIFFERKTDFPSGDDLPPGLYEFVESLSESEKNKYACIPETKILGWPSWIQNSELGYDDEFIMQIDAYDEPYWDWGDCPIIYILRSKKNGTFYASTQMF